MQKIKLGIFGCQGRMGKDIVNEVFNYKEFILSGLCESNNHPSVGSEIKNCIVTDDIGELIDSCDVIIDFTLPTGTINLLKGMQKKKAVCLVTGTTGYSDENEAEFQKLVKGLKVIRSFNMSVGVNLLKKVSEIAANSIGDISDIEIVETHHNKKKDTPSGTAISLANSVNTGLGGKGHRVFREKNSDRARRENEIGMSSIRGGNIVGIHSVFFFLKDQTIEFKHTAHNRNIFSRGSLDAARWILSKKPGLYSVIDMLG